MKFRGRMVESLAMKKFHGILGTMAKLAKLCVMRVTKDNLYFILTEDVNVGVMGRIRRLLTGQVIAQ